MKKITLLLLLTAWAGIQQPLQAQKDSSWLQLSRFSVARQSVPSFTITGAQLSEMPYSDLGQAIGVWIGPALATGTNTMFVVDGIPVNDVNIYSIQDIDSITFLQTGPGQLAGLARSQQYMVLISTKRNTSGKWQWRAAGATAFVNRADSAAKAGLYHQYNLSVANGTDKLNYGASAGYTHDVFPQVELRGYEKQRPLRENRYRVNTWLEGAVLQHHRFRLDAAYVTQRHSDSYRIVGNGAYKYLDYNMLNKDRLLNLKADIRSSLGAGFSNRIIADFFHLRFGEESIGEIPGESVSLSRLDKKVRNWMVGERFGYDFHRKQQYFSASVDVRYRHIDYTGTGFSWVSTAGVNGAIVQTTWSTMRTKSLIATPTLAWGVQDLVDVQAGMLYSILKYQNQPKHFFPFASASLDLLHCIYRQSPVSLRLYASVAAANDFPETGWGRLTQPGKQASLLEQGQLNFFPGSFGYYSAFTLFNKNNNNTRFQGGVRLGMLKNSLLLDYVFDKSNILGGYYLSVPYNLPTWINTQSPYTRHRFALSVKADLGRINWISVLSAEVIRHRPEYKRGLYDPVEVKDFFTTAGFANRLTYNSWFGALDLVGAFNKASGVDKRNTIVLQQVHLGRKFTSKATAFEWYAFARTPFNNVNLPLADLRRYYGIGCTAAF
ncbi:hypothetical protein HNQ91_001336 [Filimonas zeae]|uniref:TonB-dependent receptor plug domain-containing protein n=1 Tax=Filimonas zeae TaxID=1737353 RepID=A0A917ISV0_9BACT|nr:hypothetical protein [Filimonas zeae]MDR6338314.1 hypothetical protein [Filimonas zeae]GGH62800.1 hypothetical protein GCM10011379_13080 [Filimonas zeae]